MDEPQINPVPLTGLLDALALEFAKGFDGRKWHMRAFYQAFPIWDAVRSELSWFPSLASWAIKQVRSL